MVGPPVAAALGDREGSDRHLARAGAAAPEVAADDCAACHMPKRRTEDVVQVVMTGRHDVKRVTIDDSVFTEDKEVLEDLLAAAVNDAVRKVEAHNRDAMSGLAAGMNLPAGFKMPF